MAAWTNIALGVGSAAMAAMTVKSFMPPDGGPQMPGAPPPLPTGGGTDSAAQMEAARQRAISGSASSRLSDPTLGSDGLLTEDEAKKNRYQLTV